MWKITSFFWLGKFIFILRISLLLQVTFLENPQIKINSSHKQKHGFLTLFDLNILWSVSRYGWRVLLHYVWNRAGYILDLSQVLPGILTVFKGTVTWPLGTINSSHEILVFLAFLSLMDHLWPLIENDLE